MKRTTILSAGSLSEEYGLEYGWGVHGDREPAILKATYQR